MNILVTGATGFIGSCVARLLLERGHSVRALVRETSSRQRLAGIEDRLEVVIGDAFTCGDDAPAYLDGVDVCIHCAWYAEPGVYHHSPRNVDCVTGSLHLLEHLMKQGARKAVFVGSCFEYDFSDGVLDESTPLRPASLYAAAKASTGLMSMQFAEREAFPFVWTRVFYLYGPAEDERRLVPYLANALLDRKPAELTSGNQIRDFLHVADVASALVHVALGDLTGPINVGSGNGVTVREIAETIAEILDEGDLLRFGARPDNPTDPPVIRANSEKLRSSGWSPSYDLRNGLEETVGWWRDQREVAR